MTFSGHVKALFMLREAALQAVLVHGHAFAILGNQARINVLHTALQWNIILPILNSENRKVLAVSVDGGPTLISIVSFIVM